MRIPDHALAEIDTRGFAIVEGVLSDDEVAAAREGLWEHHPPPEDFFADPDAHPRLAGNPFAGIITDVPFARWDLTRLCFHPDLLDGVERYLGSTDVSLYKVELWAKYAGAAPYDQPHHRDYANHTLVVPRADGYDRQLTTFTLLSEVTEDDAPTMIVPLEHSRHIPMVFDNPARRERFTVRPEGDFAEVEVPVVGPAGTVLLYRTDVFHRASDFTGERRSRFTLLLDYEVRGPTWTGKVAWPNHAIGRSWHDFMARASVRERDLFGFPKPGDPYWNEQTLADVGQRYPAMDMAPYRVGVSAPDDA
ncbi:MAG: phytanoyl-CoA dioxygenase family protein [Actinomycetota bacterium]